MATIQIGGKERELRLTLGTLRRFERRSGVRLFEALAGGLGDMATSPSKKMSEADGIRLFTRVFPGMNEVSAFLYECCVPLKEQQGLSFDKFCDGIEVGSMGGVVRAILEEISEFLPEQSGDPKTAEAGAPLDQSGGPTSTK